MRIGRTYVIKGAVGVMPVWIGLRRTYCISIGMCENNKDIIGVYEQPICIG